MRRSVAVAGSVLLTVACSSPGRAPEDRSFLTFRPVVQMLPPETCSRPAVPGRDPSGKVVACYQVDPPAVDGNAIRSAKAVEERVTGAWAVEFQLTADGAKRWNDMAARVGRGHQIAIVVDETVVSAPVLDTTDFPGRGQITGDFDQADAKRLAKRLDPG